MSPVGYLNGFQGIWPDQRDQRAVVPTDFWNWGEWELKEYTWKGSFLGWFVGLVVPVQEFFILLWLLWPAQYKNFVFLTVNYFNLCVPIFYCIFVFSYRRIYTEYSSWQMERALVYRACEGLFRNRFQSWACIVHCKENAMYVFLFWELRGLNPNFYIHVSVSDLNIPRIGPHILCSRIGRSIVGISELLTDTWMRKLGLRPRNSFYGKIFGIGSLQCISAFPCRSNTGKNRIKILFLFIYSKLPRNLI